MRDDGCEGEGIMCIRTGYLENGYLYFTVLDPQIWAETGR